MLDAIRAAFGDDGRAPGRYSGSVGDMVDVITKKFGVKPENVVLGCGSTQILRSATHLFTAADKPLVGTIPTYEECAGYADMMGRPVRGVALDADFRVDLDRMADAAKGAGLIFYCNPNNPTATYVGAKASREFFARVNRESPETTILVDEAYFDYVTNPDHETHVPIAIENPRVIVARTFSKAYGMAGMRMGYAIGHPETIKKMATWDGGSGVTSLNTLALHAGIAALSQEPAYSRHRARAQHRGARFHDEVVRRPRHEADRLAGQLHAGQHRHARRRRSATPAARKASASRATSRRSRRRTAGSRSARWTR